jgi:hypothetical protein
VSTQSSALAPAYTCRICRKTLAFNEPPIIGEKPEQRMAKVGKMLADHLGTEHNARMVEFYLASQELIGWMVSEQFTHNNTDLAATANATRLNIRRYTKKVAISDETIEKQVYAHLGTLNAVQTATAIGLMEGLRDSLDEAPSKATA